MNSKVKDMETKLKIQGNLIQYLKGIVNNFEKENTQLREKLETVDYEATIDKKIIEDVMAENEDLKDESIKMKMKQKNRLDQL